MDAFLLLGDFGLAGFLKGQVCTLLQRGNYESLISLELFKLYYFYQFLFFSNCPFIHFQPFQANKSIFKTNLCKKCASGAGIQTHDLSCNHWARALIKQFLSLSLPALDLFHCTTFLILPIALILLSLSRSSFPPYSFVVQSPSITSDTNFSLLLFCQSLRLFDQRRTMISIQSVTTLRTRHYDGKL